MLRYEEARGAPIELIVAQLFDDGRGLILVGPRRRDNLQCDVTPMAFIFVTDQPHNPKPAEANLVETNESVGNAVAEVNWTGTALAILVKSFRSWPKSRSMFPQFWRGRRRGTMGEELMLGCGKKVTEMYKASSRGVKPPNEEYNLSVSILALQ